MSINHFRLIRHRGYSLLEVLVALVVISIGLLGIAAIQATALSGTHTSQTESLAALQARSLADAMLANSAFWSSPGAPSSIVMTPTSGSSVVNFAGAGAATLGTTPDCLGGGCTATNMAAYDLDRWAKNYFLQVPTATNAVVSCNTSAPPVCTIQLNWMQKASVAINAATASTSATPAAATSASYTLVNQL